MGNVPRFKTLRPYKDSVSAREWNSLTAAVVRLTRSLGIRGLSDSGGLHIRSRGIDHPVIHYRIVSNDDDGQYTLRRQVWKDSTEEFVDAENVDDILGYEIFANSSGITDQLVQVHLELSIEGRWIGFFEILETLCWGVAYEATPWSPSQYDGKYIKLHPCDDEKGAGEDSETVLKAYVFTPVYDSDENIVALAPDGLEVAQDDVLAYVPIGDDGEGGAQGVLMNPPLRLPPEGLTYQAVTKASGDDYDYAWDYIRLHE